ncbi:MAG TPA: nitroreductase family deazaflavin-dependent oxidoreductase, partial [bacterium]
MGWWIATIQSSVRAPRLMVPLMKLPLILYRLRLGWLVGHRFMRLTHVGRKSGKLRHTVLAVLRYDPQVRDVMVVSAWSASDWYYNIRTTPTLAAETGRECFAPEQRDLSAEEVATLLDEFRAQHPIVGRIFCRIPGWEFPVSREEVLELAR